MANVEQAAFVPPRLIVIGASASGLAPLREIAAALPASFPATVLVVMHVASTANSVLPEILARVAAVGVAPASDELPLRPGRILVAPPDRHLTVLDSHVCLGRGPRENGHRPAVDPLFRSAAEEYGAAACGVILSGSRDDGTAGLAQIKAHGGVTIVQDPSDAQYDGMPSNALAGTDVDFLLPGAEIGPTLMRLAAGELVPPRRASPAPPLDPDPQMLSVLCPECGGTMFQGDEAGVVAFACHIGHRYSARSLLSAHAESVERAMWTAARTLEDRATLLRRMADRARASGSEFSERRYLRQAQVADGQQQVIRDAIAALDDTEIEPMTQPNGADA